MDKIKMTTPLVEMDGDEMTRVLWQMIKDELILPFVDLKTEYYDLGLLHRNETKDQITIDAAKATARLGVAVKCATITPNKQRMEEYPQLTEMWKSPNGTIRAYLDGTAFRAPIVVPFIHPVVKNWEKPITVARHAYGDMYKAVDMVTDEPGTAMLTFKGESGAEKTLTVQTVSGPAVWQGQHNTEKSIRAFAKSCFQFAVDNKQDLWFSTKDTISKVYDGEFKRIFEEEYENNYREKFAELGITYFYTLIDDAVARVIRSKGGFIWALKNYDGDVMSDMISTAFGSLAMMTSVLVSPDGVTEYEAAHGTVTRHYYKHLKGEETSTNPMATIFAWTGALRRRGQLDGLADLSAFADKLEQACFTTLEQGTMTKDLAGLVDEGFTAEELPNEVIERIKGVSYKENPHVKLGDLAYLRVRYYDFEHKVQSGELIVARKLAQEVLDIFYELFEGGYEIEKIRLVDEYDADDERSMADNNSSAFNYRVVAGTNTISAHSYGRAIDINPLINPYIVGNKVMPANAAEYADRDKDFDHKIDRTDLCYCIFRRHGWKWGGDWNNSKDYQHFYKEYDSPLKMAVNKLKRALLR